MTTMQAALLRAVNRHASALADELKCAIIIGQLNQLAGMRKRSLWYLDGPDLEHHLRRFAAALALAQHALAAQERR